MISSCTPVMTGVTSSRDAATATWATASENASPGRTPVDPSTTGRLGYSSTGMLERVKRAEPQRTAILPSSVVNSTGALGSRDAMSASRRPETSTVPFSVTSAVMLVCAETS